MCCRQDYRAINNKGLALRKLETIVCFLTISMVGLIPGMDQRRLAHIHRIELASPGIVCSEDQCSVTSSIGKI